MMKVTKSHKLHKSSRSSPIRKEHLMKKSMHSSSSGTSRSSSSMKRMSPSMKRSPILPPSKSMHSPRLRSIASSPHRPLSRHPMAGSPVPLDRTRSLKRTKYEKRKISPPSPIRHPISPPSSLGIRGASPYHDDRYLSSGRSGGRDPHFSPPPKKKTRREPERYERSGSPGLSMLHRSGTSLHSLSHMTRRSEIIPAVSDVPHRSHMTSSVHDRDDHFDLHSRGRSGPAPVISSSKRPPPPLKVPYDSGRPERYRSLSPVERYDSSKPKHYAPTLHERFSSVVETSRTEPRIKYSREDLEKITIDIHRNIKTPSPTLRRIVNPNDVKLVRRNNEGHRPIFDREEIKQASRDMREEAYYEKKSSSTNAYGSLNTMELRDVENYEITRHRFDPHSTAFHSTSGRSLSDRWQNPDSRKDGTTLDRDHREYERQQIKRSFVDSRSKSGDQDFRSERHPVEEPSHRPEYRETSHRMIPSPERRSSIPIHRKEAVYLDARRKLSARRGNEREIPSSIRPDSRSRYPSQSEKRYVDSLPVRVEKHYSDRRSPDVDPRKYRSESSDRLSDYPRRPDKYSHKSWPEKPEMSPRIRSSDYFEQTGRNEMESYRGRGSSRPFRSARGLRTRGFRGTSRGGFPTRAPYRGGYRGASNLRGRGAPRRGRFSPGLWEHDLYSRTSEDRKLGLP